MDLYLKRYFWVLGVVVVALCAAFAARGVNQVVAAKYLSDSGEAKRRRPGPTSVATDPATAASTVGLKSKAGTPLADRNMFCSSCQPVVPVAATDAGPSDPNNPPITSLPLRLIATNV